MNGRSLAGLLALVLVLALLVGGLLFLKRPATVTFVVTGDTQGLLVPCGCKTIPSGGLARRETLLARFRGDAQAGLVVPVELGHGFADRGPGRDLLNAEMGSFFERHGYLVGLNSLDLLRPVEDFRRFAGKTPLCAAGVAGLEGYRDYRLGGWGLGPLGNSGALLRVIFLSETSPEGAPMREPAAAFREVTEQGGAGAYVVFGNLSPPTVASLVKAEPKLLAVVSWWQVFVTPVPQRAGECWLLFNGDRGRRYASVRVTRVGARWEAQPQGRYLDPDLPSDPAVQKGVEGVLASVDAVNRAALDGGKVALGSARGWGGSASCKPCHAKAWEIWSASRHARATSDLAIDHQESNPACLACHATGLGTPGGFPGSPPDLSGVGCESCHGPSGGHPPARVGAVPGEACLRCHGLRDSPGFAPEAYWALIKH